VIGWAQGINREEVMQIICRAIEADGGFRVVEEDQALSA
jgi:hypothetical protein